MDKSVKVPVGRILKLVAKAVRYSKEGFSEEERRDLGHDLLLLAAHVLEGVEEEPDQKRLGSFAESAHIRGFSPDRLT